ncbi:MAG: hypothetical protein U0894_17310, partial [Pirellulales bacterium]
YLEFQKSVDASLDRFDALWQQLPRLEQSATSIDGYRLDQFPVMASIRNEAGRNQSHPILQLTLELNRIADMARREAERLWGPADSVKQLTYAATHCRNMARNFLPDLKRKVEFIESIAAEPEHYKRPDEALQEAKRVSEWMQQYCDSTLVDAIRRFNQALQCKPDPLKFIQDATLNWHGRVLVIDQQPHQTACEAARFWCETIRRKVYDLSIRELHKKRDYLNFLKQLIATLEGLSVADMSVEIDSEEQVTLKALEPKEPAQPPPDMAAIVREILKQSEEAKEQAEAVRKGKKPQGQQNPPKKRKKAWLADAMIRVQEKPDLTDKEIAEEVGIDPAQLSRDPTYQHAAELARSTERERRQRPRGTTFKGKDGRQVLEAEAPKASPNNESSNPGTPIPGSKYFLERCSTCSDSIRVRQDQVGTNPVCESCQKLGDED